jgi:hypothetical protein
MEPMSTKKVRTRVKLQMEYKVSGVSALLYSIRYSSSCFFKDWVRN